MQILRRSGDDRASQASQLLFLGLIGFLVAIYDHYGYVTSPYRATDDARQHIFWTYRFRDPELFPDDLYVDFYSTLAPLGYRALYFLAAQIIDPLLFSKLLPFGLLGVSVWYMWRLGRAFEPRWGGLIAGLLILEYSGAMRGGLPRSFALSLLIPHFYYVATRRYGRASGVLVLQALFYQQSFLIGFGLQSVTILRELWGRPGQSFPTRLREARRPLGLLIGAALVSGLLLSTPFLSRKEEALGPVITRAEAVQSEEFQRGGRVAFFSPDPVVYYLVGNRSGLGWNYHLTTFALILLLFASVLRGKLFQAPPIILDNLAVSLFLFACAHLLLFRLYLPNRYVRWTLPISAILWIASEAWPFIVRLQERFTGFRPVWATVVRWRFGLAFLFFLAVLSGAMKTGFLTPKTERPDVVELYHFLATLPKTSLIAGNTPYLAGVPLFARRKILVDDEFALPYLKGYYREVVRRRTALQKALKTPAADEMGRFCREFGVTHLVIDPTAQVPPIGPAVLERLERERVFRSAPFFVATCPRAAG